MSIFQVWLNLLPKYSAIYELCTNRFTMKCWCFKLSARFFKFFKRCQDHACLIKVYQVSIHWLEIKISQLRKTSFDIKFFGPRSTIVNYCLPIKLLLYSQPHILWNFSTRRFGYYAKSYIFVAEQPNWKNVYPVNICFGPHWGGRNYIRN